MGDNPPEEMVPTYKISRSASVNLTPEVSSPSGSSFHAQVVPPIQLGTRDKSALRPTGPITAGKVVLFDDDK